MSIPSSCSNDDILGRGVFSQRRANHLERGICPHDIFLPPRAKNEISVNMLDFTTDKNMTIIADNMAHKRGKDFYGWAIVLVEKARKNGRDVKLMPEEENPYHANIIFPLPSNKSEKSDQQISHAHELANLARWRQRS